MVTWKCRDCGEEGEGKVIICRECMGANIDLERRINTTHRDLYTGF